MNVECPLCEGTGRVVWDGGTPRKATDEEIRLREDKECPACNGSGLEPK